MDHTGELIKHGESSRSASSPDKDASNSSPVHQSRQDVDVDYAASSSEVEEGEETDIEDAEEEDYEASRLRRIAENQLLLSTLGIQPPENAIASSSTLKPLPKPPKSTGKRRKLRATVYDRSGHIISLPNPGERQVMACIELPSDRRIRRRIAEGEYTSCADWELGEARRWYLGDGMNRYQAGEEVLIGGVGPDFRWRKWMGLNKELRNELVRRGEMNDVDARGTRSTVVLEEGVSSYSLIPGESCHQCRRKSDKEKMRCRNTNPECKASFCSTCCKRYSYFDFDPDSRSFICPLCRNICNCSNCLRKRDLSHLLEQNGERTESLTRKLKREGMKGMTVEAWLNQTVEERTSVPTPFDRVRIVCQEEDVISPELPPEPQPEQVKVKKVKRTRKSNLGPKEGGKKKKMGTGGRGVKSKTGQSVVIKFKIPTTTPGTCPNAPKKQDAKSSIREKEVDSDGDTVGGWSEDDHDNGASQNIGIARARSGSTLSSLTSMSITPPRRLAFPPRPPLASFAQGSNHLSMDIDPLALHAHSAEYHTDPTKQSRPEEDEIATHHPRKISSDQGPASIASSSTSTSNIPLPSDVNIGSKSKRPTTAWDSGLGLYETGANANKAVFGTAGRVETHSSPDPLLLHSDSDLLYDHTINGPPPYSHSPPRRQTTNTRAEIGPVTGGQTFLPIETDIPIADRDALFPDTPLWYAYNHQIPSSARPPESVE